MSRRSTKCEGGPVKFVARSTRNACSPREAWSRGTVCLGDCQGPSRSRRRGAAPAGLEDIHQCGEQPACLFFGSDRDAQEWRGARAREVPYENPALAQCCCELCAVIIRVACKN